MNSIYSPDELAVHTEEGFIIPAGKKRVSAQDVVEQLRDVLSTAYTGTDPKKAGLTKGEAALLKMAEMAQDGDVECVKYLHDRLMGKPTQTNLNVGVTADLKSFLGALTDEPIDVEAEDAQIKTELPEVFG
jgi:hypothetical protein